VPTAIDRAAERRIIDQARRSGKTEKIKFAPFAAALLEDFAQQKKSYVQAQYLSSRRAFERNRTSGVHEATFSQAILEEFEALWNSADARLKMVPGKEALSALNARLQGQFGVNITPTGIVDSMTLDEVPKEIRLLIADLAVFSSKKVAEAD
jgi:soluble lytic murein transglycosylase-like protein